MTVEGFDRVQRNLNRKLAQIKGDARAGLLEAGLQIERVSNQRAPREYGNLVNSSYTRATPEDPDVVEVGYTAAYAPFVHEATAEKLKGEPRPSGLGTYWNPGRSEFLRSAVEDNVAKIVEIVRRRAEVKP